MANINVCVHLTGTTVRDKDPAHTNVIKIRDTHPDSEVH